MSNSIEKFVPKKITRSQINTARYNPRKISKQAQENLKKSLKKDGTHSASRLE